MESRLSWLRFVRVTLLAGTLLAVVGCGSLGVALGTRTRLDKLPVVALEASLSPQPTLSPGKSGRLILVATTADGRKLTTVGAGKGTVLFDSFAFESTIAKVNGSGVVSLPADPRVSDGHAAQVRTAVVGHPDVTANLEIPSRYDTAFEAHFSGSTGFSGADGFDGISGSDGTVGSFDANSPSAGGNGGDGTNGTDGGRGGEGSPGESVHVWITPKPGSASLLQVRASSAAHGEMFFLIDSNGGSLSLDANGGAGGRGGSGGKGGRGGHGGLGLPQGPSGHDGQDGHDGSTGFPGAAGRFIVTIDPAAQTYLDRFHFANRSGNGAAGPALQVQTEAVAPLW